MNILLHPAPNWYNSASVDVDFYGAVLAVATRNTVTFFSPDDGRVTGELTVPRSERLVCLRFNNALGLRHLLATGGSDGTVRVVDVDARKEVRRIRKFKGGGITSVHFPPSAPHLLLVANQNGELFTLALQLSAPKRTSIPVVPNGAHVTCLACPPERFSAVQEERVAAAGCSNGALMVFDVVTGLLLSSWAQNGGFIAATGWNGDGARIFTTARSSQVTILSFDRDSRQLAVHEVLNPGDPVPRAQLRASWSTAAWLSDDRLVSTVSTTGQLVVWSDLVTQNRSRSSEAHSGQIFAICTRPQDPHVDVFSTSADRRIGRWRLSTEGPAKLVNWWTTSIAGFPSSFEALPDAPDEFAVCFGDGVLSLVKVRREGDHTVSSSVQLSQTSLSRQHPTCVHPVPGGDGGELVDILVGTKVGLGLLLTAKKHSGELVETFTSPQKRESSVRQIAWVEHSPQAQVEARASALLLYEDGAIFAWDFFGDGENLSPAGYMAQWPLPKASCFRISGRSGTHAALIIADSSELVLFDPAAPIAGVRATGVTCSCVSWRSETVLAFGTSSGEVGIVENVERAVVTHTTVGRHQRPISSVEWCPFEPNLLASCSDDLSIQIWRVDGTECRPVANLRGHQGRIFGCRWMSATELVSAADDHTFRWWDMIRHSPQVPPSMPEGRAPSKPDGRKKAMEQ